MLKKLVFISVLLFLCITMMVVSLVIDAQTFGQISGYFSLVCVFMSLVGVIIMMRKK